MHASPPNRYYQLDPRALEEMPPPQRYRATNIAASIQKAFSYRRHRVLRTELDRTGDERAVADRANTTVQSVRAARDSDLQAGEEADRALPPYVRVDWQALDAQAAATPDYLELLKSLSQEIVKAVADERRQWVRHLVDQEGSMAAAARAVEAHPTTIRQLLSKDSTPPPDKDPAPPPDTETPRVYTLTHPDGTVARVVAPVGQAITGAIVAELTDPNRPVRHHDARADNFELTANFLEGSAADPHVVVTERATEGARVAYLETDIEVRVVVDNQDQCTYHGPRPGMRVQVPAEEALIQRARYMAAEARRKAEEIRRQARERAQAADRWRVATWIDNTQPMVIPGGMRQEWARYGYTLRVAELDASGGEVYDPGIHGAVAAVTTAPPGSGDQVEDEAREANHRDWDVCSQRVGEDEVTLCDCGLDQHQAVAVLIMRIVDYINTCLDAEREDASPAWWDELEVFIRRVLEDRADPTEPHQIGRRWWFVRRQDAGPAPGSPESQQGR